MHYRTDIEYVPMGLTPTHYYAQRGGNTTGGAANAPKDPPGGIFSFDIWGYALGATVATVAGGLILHWATDRMSRRRGRTPRVIMPPPVRARFR